MRSVTPAKTVTGDCPVDPVREIDWWLDPNPERALEKYLQMYRSSAYARHNFKAVERLIPRPNRSVSTALDYGCGGGRITVHLAQMGYRVLASDAGPCALAACQEHTRVAGVTSRVVHTLNEAPDYWKGLDGPFDLIVAKDVLEHIADDVTFLREASARLVTGGNLLLVTQNDYSWNYVLESPRATAENPYWMGWHPTEHKRFYNMPRLKGLLAAFSLHPVRWQSHYLVPYRCWRGWPWQRLRNAVIKIAGEDVFYWPERLLGAAWPFHALGWSIHVLAVRK